MPLQPGQPSGGAALAAAAPVPSLSQVAQLPRQQPMPRKQGPFSGDPMTP